MKRNKSVPQVKMWQIGGGIGVSSLGEIVKRLILTLCFTGVTLTCMLSILQPKYEKLLWGGVLVSGLWIAALFIPRLKLRTVFIGAYLAVFAVLAWKYRALIADGFFYTVNDVFELISDYYDVRLDMYSTEAEEAKAVTAFYLAAMQVFAWIYAASVWITVMRASGRVLLLLVVCAGLPVGLVPSYWGTGLAALLLFLGLIPEQKWRALIVPVTGWLLLLGMGVIIITQEYYEENLYKPEQKEKLLATCEKINTSTLWDDLIEKAEEFQAGQKEYWENFDLFEALSGGGEISSGISGGTFPKEGKVTFDNVTVLKVTVPRLEQSVYLKGFAAATYTSDGWKGLDKASAQAYKKLTERYKQHAQELPYRYLRMLYEQKSKNADAPGNIYDGTLSATLSLQRLTMSIDYVNAGKQYRYAPYVWESEKKNNGEFVQDLYVRPKKKSKQYQYEFYTGDMHGILGAQERFTGSLMTEHPGWNDFSAFEQSYREYVYNTYTRMPEGHEQLKAMKLAADDASIYEKVNAVINCLSDYRYTLEPGDLPKGEDFVDYFLFENKKGYCMHFASSAVLLLRNMGVPARYVEGYLITESDISSAATVGRTTIGGFDGVDYEEELVQLKMVEVMDYSGHAWIEVYCNGFGWLPIEVTYGSTMGETELPEEIVEAVDELPTPTPLPTNTPMPTHAPTPTVAEKVTPIPKLTPIPTPTPKPTNTPTPTPTPEFANVSNTPGISYIPAQEGDKSDEDLLAKEPYTLLEWLAYLTGGWNTVKRLLRVLLIGSSIAGTLVLILYLRYKLVWRWRKEIFRSGRQYVLWYYRALEKLLAEYGFKQGKHESYQEFQDRVMQECRKIPEVFPEVMRLALKAAFGRERLTQEEQTLVYETYQQMLTRYYKKHSKLHMLYCKIVKLY